MDVTETRRNGYAGGSPSTIYHIGDVARVTVWDDGRVRMVLIGTDDYKIAEHGAETGREGQPWRCIEHRPKDGRRLSQR